MEEWRGISEYDGLYEVSNFGRVKRLARELTDGRKIKEKIMANVKDKDGYLTIVLYKNKKAKGFKVHRIVAKAFIPNPDNMPVVNHKDEDKTNNHVSNLEWCSYVYNNNYGTKKDRIAETLLGRFAGSESPNAKKVRVLNEDSCEEIIFECVGDCLKELNMGRSTFYRILNGDIKNSYKFKNISFSYV